MPAEATLGPGVGLPEGRLWTSALQGGAPAAGHWGTQKLWLMTRQEQEWGGPKFCPGDGLPAARKTHWGVGDEEAARVARGQDTEEWVDATIPERKRGKSLLF